MIDPDSLPPHTAQSPPQQYAGNASPASLELADLLRRRIASDGPVDFAEFMAQALYHPDYGYYARGCGQVGRGGDFFTSVSVGPVFGELLAGRLLNWWRDAGRPAPWRVIECGAHDGTLARDILSQVARREPAAFAALDYAICEPLGRLRAAQRATLADFADRISQHDDPAGLAAAPLPGVVFGNEVLDALPCHRVELRDGVWRRLRVDHDARLGFHWTVGERVRDGDLAADLPCHALPDGYRTEIRTRSQWCRFLAPLLAGLECGLMLWVDYGFAGPDYHHPSRTDGTLRAYCRHRTSPDPLCWPGDLDLTAHVEFTSFARAAEALGARPCLFRDQGPWLADLARPRLTEMEGAPDPSWIRQFQTLIHPAYLGARFQVIGCSWRWDAAPPLSAPERHRLAWPETE